MKFKKYKNLQDIILCSEICLIILLITLNVNRLQPFFSEFLLVCFFFGFFYLVGKLVILLVKISFSSAIEEFIFSLGLGVSSFIVYCSLIDFFVPSVRAFFLLPIALLVLLLIVRRNFWGGCKFVKSTSKYQLVLLLLIFFTVLIKAHASFSYEWLPSVDPYPYALITHYVAKSGYANPREVFDIYLGHYGPQYPVLGFRAVFGLLYMLKLSDLIFVLKFFSVIFRALEVAFIFLVAKELSGGREDVGLLAAFVNFSLGGEIFYLDHFIWAETLGRPLVWLSLYSALKAIKNKKFLVLTSLMASSVFLTQLISSLVVFLLLISLVVLTRLDKRKDLSKGSKYLPLSILLAFLLSTPYYLYIFTNFDIESVKAIWGLNEGNVFRPDWRWRVMTISDYLSHYSILIPFLLVAFIVLIQKKSLEREKIILSWLIILLFCLENARVGIGLLPTRFFTFLAFPISVIVPLVLRKYIIQPTRDHITLLFLILLIFFCTIPMINKEHVKRSYHSIFLYPWVYENYEILRELPQRRILYPNEVDVARGLVVVMGKDLVEVLNYDDHKVASWNLPTNIAERDLYDLLVKNKIELVLIDQNYPLPTASGNNFKDLTKFANSKYFSEIYSRNGVHIFKIIYGEPNE